MKKSWLTLRTALVISAMMVTGCGAKDSADQAADTAQETESEAADSGAENDVEDVKREADANEKEADADQKEASDFEGLISPVSREDGSGTRGAFIELFGIEIKDEAGNKVDNTTDLAEVTNSTSVMLTTVQGNEYAIGYVSLGSLNDSVKALKIDGAEATVDNIKSGTYKISRPFNIVTKEGLSDVAADFVKYIMSEDGQTVVEENGYISQGNEGAYEASGVSGKVTVAGSSSVTPVMEKLKEAYVALNPEVDVEVQQSDSTTGVNSAAEGICDIGMASRELKDSEISEGISAKAIALDGIAVIVNSNNPISDMTSDQVRSIFVGEIQDWADIK